VATKKSVSSSNNKSAPSSSRKAAAKKATNNHPSAAAQQDILSNEQIGRTAGEVWHELADSDGLSLAALKKSIDAPNELILAALGWLAREGKLDFATSGRSAKVSLREQAGALAHADA
jgi:Winged helix-turn-helix domain (DUF2582)